MSEDPRLKTIVERFRHLLVLNSITPPHAVDAWLEERAVNPNWPTLAEFVAWCEDSGISPRAVDAGLE